LNVEHVNYADTTIYDKAKETLVSQSGLVHRIIEGLRAAPAESHGGASVGGCRKRDGIAAHSVESRIHFIRGQGTNRLAHRVAFKRIGSAAVRPLARKEIRGERNESFRRQLISNRSRPVRQAEDFMDNDDHGRLAFALGVDHPCLEFGLGLGQRDVNPLAMPWRVLKRLRRVGVIRRNRDRRCIGLGLRRSDR
jgi:hypothetical protein